MDIGSIIIEQFNREHQHERPIPREVLPAPAWASKFNRLEPGASSDSIVSILQKTLPPENALPEDMQAFLGSIVLLAPEQKLQAIHRFTLHTLKYVDILNAPSQEFTTLLQNRTGDCRDFAYFEAAMAQYAGFAPDKIAMIAGLAGYTGSDKRIDNGWHVFTMVQTASDRLISLDMNFKNAQLLDEKLSTTGLFSSLDGNAKHIYLTFHEVSPLAVVTMAELGHAWIYDANLHRVLRDGDDRMKTIDPGGNGPKIDPDPAKRPTMKWVW